MTFDFGVNGQRPNRAAGGGAGRHAEVRAGVLGIELGLIPLSLPVV